MLECQRSWPAESETCGLRVLFIRSCLLAVQRLSYYVSFFTFKARQGTCKDCTGSREITSQDLTSCMKWFSKSGFQFSCPVDTRACLCMAGGGTQEHWSCPFHRVSLVWWRASRSSQRQGRCALLNMLSGWHTKLVVRKWQLSTRPILCKLEDKSWVHIAQQLG